MDKSTTFSKISNIRDDYDKFREDKGFHENNMENISSSSRMDPVESDFYTYSNKKHYSLESSGENSREMFDIQWSDEFVHQSQILNNNITVNSAQSSWADEFQQYNQSWVSEFEQQYTEDKYAHDEELEKEIIKVTWGDYYKLIDWEGNIVYKLPLQYALNSLESYVNGLKEGRKEKVMDRFKINKLIDNYRHIRNKLFRNNLPLRKQKLEDLHNVYAEGILCGYVDAEKNIRNFKWVAAVNGYANVIERYINGLALLVTLDNTNERMMNKLNNFDLSLVSDLHLEKSSVLSKFKSVYFFCVSAKKLRCCEFHIAKFLQHRIFILIELCHIDIII